jgi:tRNA (cytidine/uridine-2'-O-)-methyltransferase
VFHIALFQPEIPPNTGNIIRLCANTGCALHLIKPLGFEINDKHLKRAGLDYAKNVAINYYESFDDFLKKIQDSNATLYLCSTKSDTPYTKPDYKSGDIFIFGPETKGLPKSILDSYPDNQKIKIPMQPYSRSLNLSNAVSVIIFDAWRQNNFTL